MKMVIGCLCAMFFAVTFSGRVCADSLRVTQGLRQERSMEGQSCNAENSTCLLAYTKCNFQTRTCECDRSVSIGMKMQLYPEVVECIPLNYTLLTGHCLPTVPDMCSVLVPGSICDVSKRAADRLSNGMTCACAISGVYPNCTVRIGTLCRFNETCQKDVANSFCGNFTDGFGVCVCGGQENKTFVPSQDMATCRPTNCAADPCRGDPQSATCRDTPDGFECYCKNSTKGRSHTFDLSGMCCESNRVPCEDYSKCISVTDMCNGVVDCADCSDERKFFCTGALPANYPQCVEKSKMAIPASVFTTTAPPATDAPEVKPVDELFLHGGMSPAIWGQGMGQGFMNPFQGPNRWAGPMMG